MVAGETSGDILASGLISSIKKRYPNAQFEGIGGPLMLAEGFKTWVPMERLSVMGLVEVLGRIFELIGIRRQLKKYFIENPPDLFIGIDAPDFTIGLESQLKKAGIPTVHYVSPSVWAWRQKRIFKIGRAINLMLTLFPFEARFYQNHRIPVSFVGHPLADIIPMKSDQSVARKALGLELPFDENEVNNITNINLDESEYKASSKGNIIAILPGSRSGEIHYLGPVFLQTARWLLEREPNLRFIVPIVNKNRRTQFEAFMEEESRGKSPLPITLIEGQSRQVMAAADVILLASGTATLEAMLLKRPMVVAYRMSAITFFIMQRLMKAPYFSLPNLLANKELVPELVQAQASPPNLGRLLLERLNDTQKAKETQDAFTQIHQSLRQNASEKAADAVLKLIE
jgi:lipid-A-disaccharide synthase